MTRRFGARPSNEIDNITAVVDPTAGDDSTLGYAVDSLWVNTALDTAFICTDATEDNAVWEPLTGTPAGGGGGAGLAITFALVLGGD